MKYEVINAFIGPDGNTVEKGKPMPRGMDKDKIKRLVRAKCLRPLAANAALAAPDMKAGKEVSAPGANELFPAGVGADGSGGGKPTGDAEKAVAERDGGSDSGRAKPDGGSDPGGEGQSESSGG